MEGVQERGGPGRWGNEGPGARRERRVGGFTRQPESPKHISGSWSSKHHQNSTRRPPTGEGKKNEILGGLAEGGPAEGDPAEGGPREGSPGVRGRGGRQLAQVALAQVALADLFEADPRQVASWRACVDETDACLIINFVCERN